MFSQQADAAKIVRETLPEELQLHYFFEPQLVHAPWGAKEIAARYEQEKSWSR